MTKEEADKIAQKLANDWKLFWMSQTQNSKQDYDNYFRRALAVDANMRVHLETLISAALVDASKVTECAEFEEWISKNVSFRDGTEPIWIKNQAHYAPTKALFEQLWNVAFLSGQKSTPRRQPSLVLPSEEIIHKEMCRLISRKEKEGSMFSDILGAGFKLGADWMFYEIKRMNEGS